MSTIAEHLSSIRTRLKKHTDDTSFTDPDLYLELKGARANLLRRELNKRSTLPYAWIKQCITLSASKFHDCTCVPNRGCDVMKSNCILPSIISSKSRTMIEVYNLGNRQLPFVPMHKLRARARKKFKEPYFTIANNYIYVFNAKYEAVIVRAVFEDPLEAEGLCSCNDETVAACFDSNTVDFPIDEYLAIEMRRIVIDNVLRTLNIPDDKINNAMAENE